MAKVIKLTDNSNVTLLPITDASYVQISYAGVVKSVAETILENEEVTAAAFNDLDTRMRGVETDVSTITTATNSTLGLVKGGSSSGTTMGVSIDSNGAMTVAHYTPTGSAKTVTTSGSTSLTHNSSLVVTGLSYSVDANGHVTTLTATTGKLPADSNTDTKVRLWGTHENYNFPLVFSYYKTNIGSGNYTDNFLYSDDGASTNGYYNPNTNIMYTKFSYHDDIQVNGVSLLARSINGVNFNTSDIVSYGAWPVAASTAAKTITMPNYKLVDGALITSKLPETNEATTPTLNVNSTGAKNIYWHNVQVLGRTLAANNYYTFRYDSTNNRYDIVSTSHHGNHYGSCGTAAATVAKTANVDGFHLCTGNIVTIKFANPNTANSPTLNINGFGAKPIIYHGAAVGSTAAKFKLAGTVSFVYNGTQFEIIDASDTSYVTVNSSMNTPSLFTSTGTAKGIQFRDGGNNTLLPMTTADMIEVNYGGTSKILTSLLQENEQTTAEALIDLYNRINNYSAAFATISYQSSSLSNGGIVSGVVKNNMNRTSGNVTTIRTVNETEQVSGGTGTARTLLRYETPLINIAMGNNGNSTFPAPNSSTMNKNYYDPIKNNTNKANIYGTGSTDVAYAPMVDGNNYCDVSNSTYEMYFFNTNKLRNYLTAYARIDVGYPFFKEINSDNIWQWGPADTSDYNNTLTLKKDSISFNKYREGFDNFLPISTNRSTTITNSEITTKKIVLNQLDSGPSVSNSLELQYDHIYVKRNNTTFVNINQSQSTFNHSAYAQKFYETSDERLKTSISPIAYDPDGIGIYTFIKNDYDSYSYGFIAQNVAETHPELVSENKDTSYLSVDYNSTLSLLLAKALNRIDELEKRVSELEKNNK